MLWIYSENGNLVSVKGVFMVNEQRISLVTPLVNEAIYQKKEDETTNDKLKEIIRWLRESGDTVKGF